MIKANQLPEEMVNNILEYLIDCFPLRLLNHMMYDKVIACTGFLQFEPSIKFEIRQSYKQIEGEELVNPEQFKLLTLYFYYDSLMQDRSSEHNRLEIQMRYDKIPKEMVSNFLSEIVANLKMARFKNRIYLTISKYNIRIMTGLLRSMIAIRYVPPECGDKGWNARKNLHPYIAFKVPLHGSQYPSEHWMDMFESIWDL